MWNPFRRKFPAETRAAGAGFTAEIIAARESYISGRSGLAELTATVQSCISLWEGGLALADVDGSAAAYLTPAALAMTARSLALRGEALFMIGDAALIPCADWETRTREAVPTAYRATVPDAGGGAARTMLAAEALHIRLAPDAAAPWLGQAPLRRANLTAGLLSAVEGALREVYETAPIGSQIVPFPESPDTDMEKMGRGFRGQRGRVLLRESVGVIAAGGPQPQADWKPQDVTPDLSRAVMGESLDRARAAISMAFGVLPAFHTASATGPAIREAQRHLAAWTLAPIARLIADEAAAKLGVPVRLDVMRPLQAFDAGGRARALSAVIKALGQAKADGVGADELEKALALVDWAD